jgi:hypothetical protein
MKHVVAILTSDWHIQHDPPKSRNVGGTDAWYAAMAHALGQVYTLAKEHQCPVIVAGDLFTTWRTNAECINFLLANITEPTYAVPGQHDLPGHRLDAIKRSAYWTLVESGKIHHLFPGKPIGVGPMVLYGVPWGCRIPRPQRDGSLCLHVAVIHDFIWTKTTGHVNASEDKFFSRRAEELRGYHATVWGDNHIGFTLPGKGDLPWVCNAGTLMRRFSNERTYKPSVGLLYDDGSVGRHFLDASTDQWADGDNTTEARQANGVDLGAFAAALAEAQEQGIDIDFGDALKRYCNDNNIIGDVRAEVLAMYEKGA